MLKSRDVDLEVVLVEHGSVDDTPAIAARFAAEDPRVRVVSVDGSVDFAAALQRGLERCRAEVVARMDADDLMHPHRLREDLVFLEENPEIGAVACRSKLFGAQPKGAGMRAYVAWQNACLTPEDHARELWVEQPLCHPATTFRKAVLDEVGGYRSGPFPEDYDLFLRLHLAGVALAKREAVHHGWREHGGRATFRDPRYSRDNQFALKCRALLERYHLDERPVFIAGAGKEGGRVGRSLRELGVGITAYFDVSPRRIGRVRHGAPTFAAEELDARRREQPGAFLIGAVGTSGSRAVVRRALAEAGFVELEDAVVVC